MKQENISDAMNFIDDDLIERADAARSGKNVKKHPWVKWGALAACLCLVIVGTAHLYTPESDGKPILQWSAKFQAADYFTYNDETENGTSSSSSLDTSVMPYASERFFSDDRDQLETDEVIPEMTDYPLFDCVARYNEDDSLYSVTFTWHQRGDVYSDLSITAGYQEVEMIQDCIFIEIDEDGNIVPTAVTVTERDGVQIVAEGNENRDKTLTFQNDTGWYQIAGSWNDSYEAMADLLDWVWAHPIDFDLFDKSRGAEITFATVNEYPEAFAGCIPDFEALGYTMVQITQTMQDGDPIRAEGHYCADSDAEQAENLWWCVDTAPDYYVQQESLGDISQLTEQLVTQTLAEDSSFTFQMGNLYIQVYAKEAQKAWLLVESLQ
jgi:hypothetical protein